MPDPAIGRTRVYRQVVSIELFLHVPPDVDPDDNGGLQPDLGAMVRDATHGMEPDRAPRCWLVAGEEDVSALEELTPDA